MKEGSVEKLGADLLRSQRTTLGDLQSPSRRFDDELHPAPEVSEHVDQHVGAEKINPATEQVAHTRLRDSENLGRFRLFQTTGADDVLDMNHQVGANLEVFGLLGGKTQVTEDVAAGSGYLDFHGGLTLFRALEARAA